MSRQHIPGNVFNAGVAEFSFSTWHANLPSEFEAEWLWIPSNWAHHTGRLKKNDLVRVTCEGKFDLFITVDLVLSSGIEFRPFPSFGEKVGDEATNEMVRVAKDQAVAEIPLAADGNPVVRVDYLRASGWRMIGLHGHSQEGYESEAAARDAMEKYVLDNRLSWPDDEAIAAGIAAAQEKREAASTIREPRTPAKKKKPAPAA